MNRKRTGILLAIGIVVGVSFIAYKQLLPDEYVPADDEIALHIQLDTKEDIGLLVFDYCVDDSQFSGGMSNADKSLIKSTSDNIQVWTKKDLGTTSDTVELSIQFRIITEYVEPNFDNSYPEDISKYVDPISWTVQFGESYFVTITGDKRNGYKAIMN